MISLTNVSALHLYYYNVYYIVATFCLYYPRSQKNDTFSSRVYNFQIANREARIEIKHEGRKIYRKVSLAMGKQLRNGILVYSPLVKIKEASVDWAM